MDNFFPEAKALRETFDQRFVNPRSTARTRFVWDPWHVPDQYSALRTPAWEYFPAGLYKRFHVSLVKWGREALGMHDISPPWLSCYTDGGSQDLHGDLPHGPLAFVFSLTQWKKRSFTGGETLLLRDEILDYWADFLSIRSIERGHVFEEVPPLFNRLAVFDPRIPHGVRTVHGSRDPREGRLVIHGWFTEPRPLINGPVSRREVGDQIAELMNQLPRVVGELPLSGVLSLRAVVQPSGKVKTVTTLVDTTRLPASLEPARRKLVRQVAASVESFRFRARDKATTLTIPLVFERA